MKGYVHENEVKKVKVQNIGGIVMNRKVSLLALVLTLAVTVIACGKETTSKTDESVTASSQQEIEPAEEQAVTRDKGEQETDDEIEEDNWKLISGTDFCNNLAVAVEENEVNGERRVIALDQNGNRLFVFPKESETSAEIEFTEETDFSAALSQGLSKDECIDKNGEYIWDGNIALNLEGEIICDITDRYYGNLMGNGYMLVKEIPTGYEQKAEKMGVIDGYGNEVIPVSEEFAEICGGDLLSPTPGNAYCRDGIAFFPDTNMVVDANQGIYYSNQGSVLEYRNGNLLVNGGVMYKDQGNTTIGFEAEYNTTLALSDDKVISLTYNEYSDEGVFIKTYDFEGNLLGEKNITDIALESNELHYDNGISSLYIEGGDGNSYVTLIDEYGNFKFEPIMNMNYESSEYTNNIYANVSEGVLRLAKNEEETIFIDENGNEILNIPYNIEYVGNCESGKIVVNTGIECFYVDKETGEYLNQCK